MLSTQAESIICLVMKLHETKCQIDTNHFMFSVFSHVLYCINEL